MVIMVEPLVVFLIDSTFNKWTQTDDGLPVTSVTSFLKDGQNIYAGTEKGLYVSTNGGADWEIGSSDLNNIFITLLKAGETELYAGTLQGLFHSTDGGKSWTLIYNGLLQTIVGAFYIDGVNLYTGYSDSGIYVSTDNGDSWQPSNVGLTNTIIYTISKYNSNIIVGTFGNGVFISKNNGSTWSPSNSGLINTDIQFLISNGNNLSAGESNGIGEGGFLSTDYGVTWNHLDIMGDNSNYSIKSFVVSDTNIYALVGFNGIIYLSTNNGVTWDKENFYLKNWQRKLSFNEWF